jgi:hypothetical protein
MDAPINDRDRVTEEIARQLLTRAATLDSDGRQLTQLRDAAIEAGISGDAFDQAVREWRAGPTAPPARTWKEAVLRNLAAFAGGYAALLTFSTFDRLLAVPSLVHKLTDPVGLLVGVVVATKLRARTATILMGGLAVSQSVEFLMDLLAGAPAIRGFYPHIALMIAGVGGVAASQIWRSRDDQGTPSSPTSADAASVSPPASDADDPAPPGVGLTFAEADKRFIELLRLRRNSYMTRLQLS